MYDNTNFPIATNTKTKKIIDGIRLILKYQEDATFSCDHDILFFGNYQHHFHPNKMTEIELLSLYNWGWFEQDESWAIYL